MGVFEPNRKSLMTHFRLLQTSTGVLFLGMGYVLYSSLMGNQKPQPQQLEPQRAQEKQCG
eukprot:1158712-Pelagomonas_calceolata.AAC.4